MKVVKLKEDHYIIVDDSEIKDGDYKYHHVKGIAKATCDGAYTNEFKITHSTKPIEKWVENGKVIGWKSDKILPITLSEVKELFGVDVEKKVKDYVQELIDCKSVKEHERTWISAICHQIYTQALEDNKEKKYTEEDVGKIFYVGVQLGINQELYAQLGKPLQNEEEVLDRTIKSLQPKTEWEVEFIDGKLKLKS